MTEPGFAHHPHRYLHVGLDALLDEIPLSQSSIRLFGKSVLLPRLTAWMGEGAYTYSGIRHLPMPLSPIVAELRADLEALTGARFNSVLANYYRDGRDSVAWHADDEPELGPEPVIASVSFGHSRNFAIRKLSTATRHDILLEHGDALIMSGPSQREYQHAILKSTRPMTERLNLTFRYVAV